MSDIGFARLEDPMKGKPKLKLRAFDAIQSFSVCTHSMYLFPRWCRFFVLTASPASLRLPNCTYASPVARPEVSATLRKLYYSCSSLPQAFSPPRLQICTLVTVRGAKKRLLSSSSARYGRPRSHRTRERAGRADLLPKSSESIPCV